MSFKKFLNYLEEMGEILPSSKQRNGLADPDPGQLKATHKPSSQDLEFAKQALQIAMTYNSNLYKEVYEFLSKLGEKVVDIDNLVQQMKKPEGDKVFGQQKMPDTLQPNNADTYPAYYEKD